MEQSGLEVSKQNLRNLRKFRRNGRKFQSPEVSDNYAEVRHLPERLRKIKIKLFEIILLYPFRELMVMKIKTLELNHMKKKMKLQFNVNNYFHTQECTKAFNVIIQLTTS